MKSHLHSVNRKPSPTYVSWSRMKQRCLNKNSDRYPFYGGRGISLSEAWLSFENFLKDMGERPLGMTLERVDNSKDYRKENCKWVDRKTQANNRRSSKILKLGNEEMTLSQWGEKTGIDADTIGARLKYGWSLERALTEESFKGKNQTYMYTVEKVEAPTDHAEEPAF